MEKNSPEMQSVEKRPKRRRHIIYIAICVLLLLVAAAGAIVAFSAHKGEDVWIYIPADATEESVADTLNSNLGAAEGGRVLLMWRMFGGDAAQSHGAYKVSKGQKAVVTARRMAKGMQSPVRVSWNNVRTLPQLADRLADRLEFSSDEFLEAVSVSLPSHGYKPAEFVAAFLPDTYEFYWTASPQTVIDRMVDTSDKFWSARSGQLKSIGLTPVEVATLASIVEEETSKADEYGKIARLYMNRLERGMPLQADPTVKFAIGDFSLRRITHAHLGVESPYNTYRNKGLPPGPIRVASPRAIDAVLSAPRHNYIYMCADDKFSGYHNFAADYASVRPYYQAELNRRGIR